MVHGKYYLESFYSFSPWQAEWIDDHFMLDSGAFTFMNSQKNARLDWDEYVDKYAQFIKKHNIKLFFELDIDAIVGIREVERLRSKLETITGRKCIPVWHKSRGKEYFMEMVKRYDYVAIGGIVTKEIKPKEYPAFKWFIHQAHQNGCKIHGLGFTNVRELHKYKFDSVDSTSWLSGGRYGAIVKFNGRTISTYKRPAGKRVHDYKVVDRHNFLEWVKFQRYAEAHL